MAKDVKVIVVRTAGTNCDMETVNAFSQFGAMVERVHVKRLLAKEVRLQDYHILAIPGGFTYGDDIESGRLLANELRLHLGDDLAKFITDGKLIIGICNGFQVLVKAGILPGSSVIQNQMDGLSFRQTATLTNNDSGKFEDRWVYLKVESASVWLNNLPAVVEFPVAHAEGKFLTLNAEVLSDLKHNGQVAFRYCNAKGDAAVYPENPNGAVEHIAGITDATGRILGLMPHPERHFYFEHHPSWNRRKKISEWGEGAQIFKNGVEYIKGKFLR